jgi:hypothetical protein
MAAPLALRALLALRGIFLIKRNAIYETAVGLRSGLTQRRT